MTTLAECRQSPEYKARVIALQEEKRRARVAALGGDLGRALMLNVTFAVLAMATWGLGVFALWNWHEVAATVARLSN